MPVQARKPLLLALGADAQRVNQRGELKRRLCCIHVSSVVECLYRDRWIEWSSPATPRFKQEPSAVVRTANAFT